MAQLITVYWRDIPAQIIVKKGRKSSKVMLSSRFQEGIDRAAMRAGKGSSDAYMEDWRREAVACEGSDADAKAADAAKMLENAFDDESLERLVKAKGLLENLV